MEIVTGLEEMKWDKDAKLGAVKLTHRNHLLASKWAHCAHQLLLAKKHHDVLGVIIAIEH